MITFARAWLSAFGQLSSGVPQEGTCRLRELIHSGAIDNGQVVCSDSDISAVFPDHYRRLGTPSATEDSPEYDDTHFQHVHNMLSQYHTLSHASSSSDAELDATPTFAEVEGAVKHLENL